MADLPVTNFTTGQNDGSPATSPSPGLLVGSQVSINGSIDLSSIVTCINPGGGAGGLVNWITLQDNPGGGIYPYQLQINGQGPAGAASGSLYMKFTDAAGGVKYIKLVDSSPYTHTLDYQSDDPNILKIEWDHSFADDEEGEGAA